MRYWINDKTLAAKKARILIQALIECVRAGVKPSFVTNQMLWGISLYLECGKFKRENRRSYSRVSDAARRIIEAGDKDWKRKVTFEHVRPLSKMYQMMFEERKVITPERAAYIIGEYPPILITLEEEYEMAARGFKVEASRTSATPRFRSRVSVCVESFRLTPSDLISLRNRFTGSIRERLSGLLGMLRAIRQVIGP